MDEVSLDLILESSPVSLGGVRPAASSLFLLNLFVIVFKKTVGLIIVVNYVVEIIT